MEYPKVKNSNRVYIVSDLIEVKQVISIPKDSDQRFDINDVQFIDFMVWEHYGQEENTLKPGDKISLEMDFYRCLKQIGPIVYTGRNFSIKDWDKKAEKRKQMFTLFANNFNNQLILESKESLKNIIEDDEVAYRCFYNSFKMYRCRDYVIEMAKMLISLAEQKKFECQTNEELIKKFEELEFDDVLVRSLKKNLGTLFAMNRNDPQAWFDDSETLLSGYTLFIKACDYLIRFCERIKNKDCFFQYSRNEGRGSLTWDEAGAMMVWGGISFLRTSSDEDHLKYSNLFKT